MEEQTSPQVPNCDAIKTLKTTMYDTPKPMQISLPFTLLGWYESEWIS